MKLNCIVIKRKLYNEMKEIIQHSPGITIDVLHACIGGIKYYKGIDGIFKGKLDANKTKLLYSIKSLLLVAKKQFMKYNEYITQKSAQLSLKKHIKCNNCDELSIKVTMLCSYEDL